MEHIENIDEYEKTFNNRLRYLSRIENLFNKNLIDAIEEINDIIDPKQVHFEKASLKDYFYREYMIKAIDLGEKIIKKRNRALLKIKGDNQKNQLIFFINKLESNIALKKKELFQVHFSNNFNELKENDVYNYFYSKLVSPKYLTEKQLIIYLKIAFNDLRPSSKKIIFSGNPTKKTIRKVFYGFYKEVASNNYNQKEKYVRLLSDYFEGFNFKSLMSNFSKTY